VQIIAPTNGQTLVYNSVTQLWENSSGGGATGYQTIQGNGSSVAQETTVNFIGTGVTVVDDPGSNRTNVTITSGSNYQTIQGQGTPLPQEAVLNFISDSFTITDDPSNNSTNVAVSGVISWDVVTSNTSMSVQMGYIPNSASKIIFLMPASTVPGDTIRIVGFGTGLWEITQNAGQSIRFGDINTTTGTGGSITSTNQGDSVEVICVVANTVFVVGSATGTLSIV
jgi:hypothetical protein